MQLIITIISALSAFIIGLFVLSNNKKSHTNLLFSIFCFSLSFWAIANYFSLQEMGKSEILFWMRAVMAIAVIISIAFFLFVHTFPGLKIVLRKKYLIGILALGFLTIITAFSPFLFRDVLLENGQRSPVIQPGMLLFLITAVGSLLLGFIILIKRSKKETGLIKIQFKYIFLGTFIMFLFILIFNFFLVVILKVSAFVNWGPFFVLPFIFFTTYAITRHRLMDIRIVIKHGLVTFFPLILVIFLVWGMMIGVGKSIGRKFDPKFMIAELSSVILAIIIYSLARKFFERFTNKYLFRTLYTSRQAIEELTKKTTTIIELPKLIDAITDTIMKSMGLKRAGVLLMDPKTSNYQVAKVTGFTITNGISLVRNNYLTQKLSQTEKPVILQELELLASQMLNGKERADIEKLKTNMKRIEASLCLPLIIKNKLLGIIVLGDKISNEAYTKEDLELLETLSNQSAVAIENARLYNNMEDIVNAQTKDIKEKNIHLKKLLEMRSKFLDTASHQLRTPVSLMKGVMEMVHSGEIEEIKPERKKMLLDGVFIKAKKLETIISDILDATEMDTAKFTLTPGLTQVFPVEELLTSVVESHQLDVETSGLSLTYQKPPKPLPEVQGSRKHLDQVFNNLLDNAIKYTPKKNEETGKQGQVLISAANDDKFIIVKVSDNGIGIPAYEIKNLYEKFGRASNAKEMYTDGTGLGLYIVKEIIDGHHGKIEVESKLGEGSTFTVRLPYKK